MLRHGRSMLIAGGIGFLDLFPPLYDGHVVQRIQVVARGAKMKDSVTKSGTVQGEK